MVSTDDCGSSSSGSNPDAYPKYREGVKSSYILSVRRCGNCVHTLCNRSNFIFESKHVIYKCHVCKYTSPLSIFEVTLDNFFYIWLTGEYLQNKCMR